MTNSLPVPSMVAYRTEDGMTVHGVLTEIFHLHDPARCVVITVPDKVRLVLPLDDVSAFTYKEHYVPIKEDNDQTWLCGILAKLKNGSVVKVHDIRLITPFIGQTVVTDLANPFSIGEIDYFIGHESVEAQYR